SGLVLPDGGEGAGAGCCDQTGTTTTSQAKTEKAERERKPRNIHFKRIETQNSRFPSWDLRRARHADKVRVFIHMEASGCPSAQPFPDFHKIHTMMLCSAFVT